MTTSFVCCRVTLGLQSKEVIGQGVQVIFLSLISAELLYEDS